MKISRRMTMLGMGVVAAGLAPAEAAQAQGGPVGSFIGTLDVGPAKLRLRLVLDSGNKATLYSIDQGNSAIPASDVKSGPEGVKISFSVLSAVYEAKFSGADRLEGTFTQMGQPFPLTLTRGEGFAAGPLDNQRLDQSKLDAYRMGLGTPGMVAAWVRATGKPTVLLSGSRRSDGPAPVALADKWHLGSITKSMTATLIARLVEAGKLSWDSKVGDVLGKALPGMAPAYRQAHLIHLLSHRSGLPANLPVSSAAGFSQVALADARAERLRYCALALAQPPEGQLGEKMIYSNSGYTIAGAMAEAVTGKSWEALMTEYVFKPLKLKSAGFGPPPAGHPAGHVVEPDGKRSPMIIDNPVAIAPAGWVHMSVLDGLAYLAAHRDRPAKFLKAASWERLHTAPFGGDYALGWVIGRDGGLWHNGSNTLWYAEVAVSRRDGVIALFAGNDAASISGGPGKVLQAALRAGR